MSAFAVLYERTNTPAESGVLVRVMDRLQHRGPDGSDVTVNGPVVMGHWHFWTTPEDVGEKQPLQVEGLPFTIVMDGRLDNRSDLIAELALSPQQASRFSDTLLVLCSYDRWGEHCFEHFIGEFAIVIHDEKRNELICARDALGDRTLFYSFQGSRVVIASEPWAIAGASDQQVELHEEAVARFFVFKACEDGQTLFKDIFELLPAHVLCIAETGQRTWTHWQPDFLRRLRGMTNEEYAREFLHLLEQSVQSRIRSATPIGIQMSGGLDSTSVAALTARLLAPTPLTTFSFVFNELPDCDERPYINAMVERWGINSIQIPCDDAWPYKDWHSWRQDPNEPDGNLYRLAKDRVYARTKQEGIRVLLTGGFGDHLYSAGDEWLADLVMEGRLLEAAKQLYPYLRYGGLRWTWKSGFIHRVARRLMDSLPAGENIHRKESLPVWLRPEKGSAVIDKVNRDANLERYANLLGLFTAQSSSGGAASTSRHAVELRHPYRDRRLVEFVLALPGYQLYYRGVYKHVLRNAMKGILPEKIRTRIKPTSLISLYNRGIQRETELLRSHMSDRNAKWRTFVRNDWLKERWRNPIDIEEDGPEALIPYLCLSYDVWHKSIIHSS